eukprot:Colp12_sorted_trinity150504_noHs@12746
MFLSGTDSKTTDTGIARPVSVKALGSTGVAESMYGCPAGTEDTITLLVEWENTTSKFKGTAIYVASWSASAKAEVHSQQRFTYQGHKGEVRVDQAHRGYEVATDENGYASVNPLYMAYLPGPNGHFNGHHGYGYKSIEAFIQACIDVNSGKVKAQDCDRYLPTAATTEVVTAILEAGRLSLDNNGRSVNLNFVDGELKGIALAQ